MYWSQTESSKWSRVFMLTHLGQPRSLRYDYTGRGNGEVGDFIWCTCTVIATEKVPKGPRSISTKRARYTIQYTMWCTVIMHDSARRVHDVCTIRVHARSVGRRRSRGAARGGDRERLQAPEKQVEQKSHGEGAWRLDLDHISRGRRHRTGSVFKVPVFVVLQLAILASWA